jgi:hypothetical protein
MSVETMEEKYGSREFWYVAGPEGEKKLLAAQDKLVAKFKKDGDTGRLRKGFQKLRQEYLEACLTAYAKDFDDMNMPLHMVEDLLALKVGVYTDQFARELGLLFKGTPWRNYLAVCRFESAGNRVVAELIKGV